MFLFFCILCIQERLAMDEKYFILQYYYFVHNM